VTSTTALHSPSVSTFDADPWIQLDWAIAALARTSTIAVPAKLVFGRWDTRASVRMETTDSLTPWSFADLNAAANQYLKGIVGRTGCRVPTLTPTPKPTRTTPLSFSDRLSESLADALDAAEWKVTPRAKDSAPATTPLRAAPPWAATSFATIAPAATGYVRVALGVDVIRAEHEAARRAVGLFALQASARLLLARATLGSATSKDARTNGHDEDKLTIGWDAVVPAIESQPVERAVVTITHAVAACDVARRLTLESARALARSGELADAYFASDARFERFRSIGAGKALSATTANTNTEENDECRPQPQL